MQQEENQTVPSLELQFRVIEKGQWVYILWPWDDPASFIYQAYEAGARYRLAYPIKASRLAWIELVPQKGWFGEYKNGLLFGYTEWGYSLYRRFASRGCHYLTQHGLDGIAEYWWSQAYEIGAGRPVGDVLFEFRVEAKDGLFTLTNWDWSRYFMSGRNGRLSDLGIAVTKKKGG